MKQLLSIYLSFFSLCIYSQTDSLVYYRPNYYTQFLLDSLNVPFIPLDLRNDVSYNNNEYISEFNNYFSGDLVYLPNQNTDYYDFLESDLEDLFGNLKSLLKPDGVIGEKFIEDRDNLYRLIEYFDIVDNENIRVYYFKTALYKLSANGGWVSVTDPPSDKLPRFNKTYR